MRIASIKGKLYQLIEMPPEEVAAIASTNGYEDAAKFLSRFDNWQATTSESHRIIDCSPVRPPKTKTKPTMMRISSEAPRRGRPRKVKAASDTLKKKPRKRRSKYGFEKLKAVGDCIFVTGETYRVAAAAAYFGSKYPVPRKYSVFKAKVDGKSGSRVERVE